MSLPDSYLQVQKGHRRATEASLLVALVLLAGKFAVYLHTESLAVLSTAIDSALDLVVCIFNLLAVRLAQSPADEDHHFGHGKAEPLAGLVQTLFIGATCTYLFHEGYIQLSHPNEVQNYQWGIAIAAISAVITMVLVRYQTRVLKKGRSLAVSADRLHFSADVFLNLGVILSLIVGELTGFRQIDALFGMIVAFYLAWGAIRILIDSAHNLMDKEMSEADRNEIHSICIAHPMVQGTRNIRTRSSGPFPQIQVDLELDQELQLSKAHDIGEEVEIMIKVHYPLAAIVIHHEPILVAEKPN